MDYSYPIDLDWSTDEIVTVVSFFECIEKAYENGIDKSELMNQYRLFKQIVPGKSQEKKVCDEFEEVSGYSTYRTIKKAKELSEGLKVKMP
ncbi:UPF0223 family protein [Bacillus sp. B1-b2]|uniref:UPF0223 family protein n=1 Tax=Bacillus sp. B1-b2 TaxID=2653201 RepID=UPI0012625A70|nr:UPF0223 family protein [Bacillus sp. B1-b2]KAB7669305.1 UPF0223 family protein [Bacillus sp. B1-b2]